MGRVTGTFRFKTKQELLSSGWINHEGTLRHFRSIPVITREMRHYFGETIVVNNGVSHGWNITREMVITDEDIVDRILTKYSNG